MKKKCIWLTKLEKFHGNQEFMRMEKQISKVPRITYKKFKNSLERDSREASSICQCPLNQIDEVRIVYLKWYSWFGIMI